MKLFNKNIVCSYVISVFLSLHATVCLFSADERMRVCEWCDVEKCITPAVIYEFYLLCTIDRNFHNIFTHDIFGVAKNVDMMGLREPRTIRM